MSLIHYAFGAVVALSQVASSASPQAAAWLFVDRDLKWEAGPPGLGYQASIGSVTLFQNDGQVFLLSCSLYRDSKRAQLMIGMNSGYLIQIGRWRLLANRKVEIKMRVVAEDKLAHSIDQSPQTLPGEEKTEIWTIADGDSPSNARRLISIHGEQRRLSSLRDRDDFDRLVKRYLR